MIRSPFLKTFVLLLTMFVAACRDDSPPGTNDSPQPSAAIATNRRPADGGVHNEPPAERSIVRFVDRAASSGIDFTYVNGEEAGHFAILESLGGGGALFDYDRDGRLDVALAGGGRFTADNQTSGEPTGLYRSIGAWWFASVQEQARFDDSPYYSHGIAAADFDNDGFTDVLVTGYGGLTLLRNCGDGTFENVTQDAGLTDTSWSSGAAWGDITGDGDLDLYVAHYVDWSFDNHPDCRVGPDKEVCPPRKFKGLPDLLYVANGDGTFRDATSESGLEPGGKGLGVVMADMDRDGAIDVYVSNDTVPNFLYRNEGDGRLANQAISSGAVLADTGVAEGSMGVDVGDYNGDGLPDIWVANYENESYGLYRNSGSFFFQHVSKPAGVTAVGSLFVGWGTSFIDFDSDGDQDLIATNGHVIRHPMNAPLRQRPLLLENLAGKRLVKIDATDEYLSDEHMGRGLATGDVDGDGDNDVLITHTNEPAALLENTTVTGNHWIGLRLVGVHCNRDAIGSIVRIVTNEGREQYHQVKGGGSYASTSSSKLLIGLGSATVVPDVEIHWPDGSTQRLDSPEIDQSHVVIQSVPIRKD